MSKSTTLASALVQAQGDATARLLDNGWLKIYSGAQPVNADTAIGTQVLLASLRFDAVSAPATPATGVITFNTVAMAAGAVAVATGTAAWFRCQKADGVTDVLDGSVDVAGNTPNLALSTIAIVSGATVSITALTHSINKSTAGY